MDEEEVLQRFTAEIEPYIGDVEAGVRAAQDFAQANEDAKFAIDEMRDTAAETGEALGHARDEAFEAAEADRDLRDAAYEAAEALGHLRDEAATAAEAIGAEGAASLGAGAASSAGILSSLAIPAIVALAAALALALAALFPVLAVLPLIGIGFTGLAAIAVPEITKVWHAVSVGGKAWAALSPEQKAAGRELRGLHEEFSRLAKAVQPEILTAFDQALKIIRDLMPAIRPLIIAAGKALDTFFSQIAHWLQSGSGQKFIQWMKVDGAGAIKAFGEFLWGLISVLGRTFSFLFNFGETVHRVFDQVRHDIARWADDTAHDFDLARHRIASWGHDIAQIFDTARHDVAHWADDIRHAVDSAIGWVEARLAPFTQFWHQHSQEIEEITRVTWSAISTVIKIALGIIVAVVTVAWKAVTEAVRNAWMIIGPFLKVALEGLESLWRLTWGIIRDTVVTAWDVIKAVVVTAVHVVLDVIGVALDLITGHWSQAWADVKKLTSDALHGVISIIVSLTAGFGHLLWDAGVNLIKGLIGGIESMVGAVGSVVSGIAHKVAGFFGLSPAREGPLAGGGAPYIRGQHFAADIAAGMRSSAPGLAAAAADLAGIAAAHLTGRAPLSAALGPGGGIPALAGAGGPAAAGPVINVTINGSLIMQQQLRAFLQDVFLEYGHLNNTAGIWPLNKGVIR